VLGWVYSTAAPISSVEAFIDDVNVRSMTYGIERYDVVATFPAEAPVTCGFGGRISLVGSSLEGVRQLTIRVRDEIGNECSFRRSITIEPLKLSPYPAGPPGWHPSTELSEVERELRKVVAEFEERMDRAPSILDWDSGLNLHSLFPNLPVCSPIPLADANRLPYLDSTIDIVAVPASALGRLEEARRVAAAAIVCGMEVQWKSEAVVAVLPETSIIVPVYNNVRYTEQCLAEIGRTLPHNFSGEIIVVDDASMDDTPAVLKRCAERDPRIKVIRNSQNSGFIRTCNRGAEAASGEILVFLNNDTLPLPGWLPPLLRTLRDKPNAGAVGGKLVYPDGRLQEAGGVIFSDGSGLNFGRNEDADDPVYNFLREVDYCSGALLATRRTLFLELGGFDLRFEPAYYEDTDYCFTLRRHGYRVYYQPESAIVHFEGATSGTDPQSGVKRYQIVNQSKFVEKWREALERQPDRLSRYDFGVRYALSMRVPMKSNHAN
jgi:GT2 family glycosyltransferase